MGFFQYGWFHMDIVFPGFRVIDRAFTVVIIPLTLGRVVGVVHCELDVAAVGD